MFQHLFQHTYLFISTALTVSADTAGKTGRRRNDKGGHLFGHQGHHTALRNLGHKGEVLGVFALTKTTMTGI